MLGWIKTICWCELEIVMITQYSEFNNLLEWTENGHCHTLERVLHVGVKSITGSEMQNVATSLPVEFNDLLRWSKNGYNHTFESSQ